MGNTVDPGSSVETQCPGFLLGAGHIGILSYHIPKFQMPRRKADVQPEPPCSHKWFRYSESLITVTQQLGNSMNPSEIQVPKGSPWAKLARKSLRTAVSGLCYLLSPFT